MRISYEYLVKKIYSWIKQQVKQANAEGVVFGLSGGVDSSVVAILCKKAFPKEHLALLLPCMSTQQDLADAELVIKKFNLNSRLVDLTEVYLKFCDILSLKSRSKEIATVNIKPRLRMIVLYYFANKLNYLVVGTGNKSELTMGYFTKYGDGAVDILPLGELTKTQVRKLAKVLQVPESIIKKMPSAGLWEGQTDEGEMGITYEQLDKIIEVMESKRELERTDEKLYERVLMVRKKAKHKLNPPKIFRAKTLNHLKP